MLEMSNKKFPFGNVGDNVKIPYQALKGIRDVDLRKVLDLSVNGGEREIFVIQNATTV